MLARLLMCISAYVVASVGLLKRSRLKSILTYNVNISFLYLKVMTCCILLRNCGASVLTSVLISYLKASVLPTALLHTSILGQFSCFMSSRRCYSLKSVAENI